MKNKILISFIFIFILQFLLSCIPCKCPKAKSYKFNFDRVIFDKKITKLSAENEIAFSVILKDSSKILANSTPNNTPKGAFMNSAWACSCAFARYGILDNPLKSIKIITKFNFDTKHKAGADVSDLFVINDNENPSDLYFNLTTYTTKLNNEKYMIYFVQTGKIDKKILFYLKNRPEVESSKFIVKFEFENGQILDNETDEFIKK